MNRVITSARGLIHNEYPWKSPRQLLTFRHVVEISLPYEPHPTNQGSRMLVIQEPCRKSATCCRFWCGSIIIEKGRRPLRRLPLSEKAVVGSGAGQPYQAMALKLSSCIFCTPKSLQPLDLKSLSLHRCRKVPSPVPRWLRSKSVRHRLFPDMKSAYLANVGKCVGELTPRYWCNYSGSTAGTNSLIRSQQWFLSLAWPPGSSAYRRVEI